MIKILLVLGRILLSVLCEVDFRCRDDLLL